MADILNAIEGEQLAWELHPPVFPGQAVYWFSPGWWRIENNTWLGWLPWNERMGLMTQLFKKT